MKNDIAIEVKNLTKSYTLYEKPSDICQCQDRVSASERCGNAAAEAWGLSGDCFLQSLHAEPGIPEDAEGCRNGCRRIDPDH